MADEPFAPPAPGPAVASTPPPPPPAAPAPPAGPPFGWEDRVAVPLAYLALLGTLLPWFDGHEILTPTPQGWSAAALSALALGLLLYLSGPANERLRRQLSIVLGSIVFLLCAWVGVNYFLFHHQRHADLGVVGHLGFLGWGLYLTAASSGLLAWTGIRTTRAAPAPAPPARHVDRGLRWYVRLGMPALVFVGAISLYATDLEDPAIIDFDEAHYVKVARNMTDEHIIDAGWCKARLPGLHRDHGIPQDDLWCRRCPNDPRTPDGVSVDPRWCDLRPYNFEHPPVGKYFIAGGYWLAGEPHDDLDATQYEGECRHVNPECERDAWSWRIGSAVVGALGVVGVYWTGLRLFRSVAVGAFSAAFLLLDGMYYLHSRIALLDIFSAAFTILAFGVFLGPSRGHRWAGSLLFGVALASKHSALFLAPPFFVLAYLLAPHASRWMRLRDALIYAAIVPLAAYVVTYAPYWYVWWDRGGVRFAIDTFVYIHSEGFRWLYRADATHTYMSDPWTWIVLRRPVLYYIHSAGDRVARIYSFGNPLMWWLAVVGVLYTWFNAAARWVGIRPRYGFRAFWEWLARPFDLHRENALLFASLLFVSAYGPFFLLRRNPFNFYFVLVVPYLALMLGAYMGPLWSRRGPHRLLAIVALVAVAAAFAFFHPIVSGGLIKDSDLDYILHRIPEINP